jgi:hypothetical protein
VPVSGDRTMTYDSGRRHTVSAGGSQGFVGSPDVLE